MQADLSEQAKRQTCHYWVTSISRMLQECTNGSKKPSRNAGILRYGIRAAREASDIYRRRACEAVVSGGKRAHSQLTRATIPGVRG